MKSISAGLRSHLQGGVTTIATCWKLTRRDGAVYGFTDHIKNLTIDGLEYIASTGYTASAIQTAAALNVDNLEAQGAVDSSAISEADLLAGLWDFSDIEIFQVNYADLTQGALKLRKGNLGEVRTGKGMFVAELRGMMQKLQQAVGYLVQPGCSADLGDARCKFPLVTSDGSIDSVTSNRTFFISVLSAVPDGYYAGGLFTFTSGLNAGLSMEVKTFTAGLFSLTQPMPFTVQSGDGFSVYPGCDKTLATCRDKFSNVVNFRGFPHLPGVKRITSGK